jgi:hypothetical protein
MAYVRLDKVGADQHIESIVATTDLVNGQFLALGALQADGEAREVTASGDQAEELVFHASVPLTYEERTNELDFVLKAGKVGRGYVLRQGNIVSVSIADGITGVAVKGALVNPSATGFDVVDGTDVAGALHGEIIAIETDMYAGNLAVIRISKK